METQVLITWMTDFHIKSGILILVKQVPCNVHTALAVQEEDQVVRQLVQLAVEQRFPV